MKRRNSPLSRKRRAHLGFALLEALVAMAIAAVALAALYRSVGQGSKTAGDVEMRVEAALLAQSVLAASAFAEDFVPQAEGKAGVWRWQTRTLPEQIVIADQAGRPVGRAGAARITVDVYRQSADAPVASWTTWKPWRAAP